MAVMMGYKEHAHVEHARVVSYVLLLAQHHAVLFIYLFTKIIVKFKFDFHAASSLFVLFH